MSYILEALKKAAEQRTGPAVEVRRLLTPPQVGESSIPRYVTLGVGAVALLSAAIIFWVWVPTSAVTDGPVAPVASVVGTPAAGSAAAAAGRDERPGGAIDDRPRLSLPTPEPKADARRPTAEDTRRPVAKPRVSEPSKTADTARAADAHRAADAARVTDAPRVADAKPPRMAPPAAIMPAPAPPGAAAVPSTPAPGTTPAAATTPAPATTRGDTNKLKVEVIVYADQPTQRWVFINGRKYVEGDSIGEGGRVEEIQVAGVVIVEDGRRVTLRP